MIKEMFEDKKIIGVVGLGYVGLPLSTVFSKKYEVIGFDVDKSKIENYSKGIDVTNELEEDTLKNSNIKFSSNPQDLSKANFIIITVPTPIHKDESPDLSYVISATETVASNMKEGTIIVYESTVFPGATEEVCIPIIEEITGFECGKEFSVGYSPERINPGKNSKDVSDIVKIVSGYDEETTNIISEIYDSVLNNGIYRAPSIKVAEAAKITENIQRDVNIALMNELSIIFDKMDLDTNEIIDAAGTKWNFMKFRPGLVGGHCIGIDPYYLIYKSKKLNYSPRLLQTSRNVNEDIINQIIKTILLTFIDNEVNIKKSNILVLGITFKENCNDIRNSKIVEVIDELKDIGANVTIYDPLADAEEVKTFYDLELSDDYEGKYDSIIIGVSHDEFKDLTIDDINRLSKNKPILFDLKSLLKELSKEDIVYWSL